MSTSNEQRLADADATLQAGKLFGATLPDAAVIGLDGPLGAGKTTFVRGVALALGVPSADISSPSFTMVIEHKLPDGRILRHVDAWRLAHEQELETLGWNEWVGEVGSLTIIEWASRIESAMPPTATRLRLDYDESSGRVLWDTSGEMP
jgi:tRNA threonylcarbamoyladenosine biosynthesis protein TsaE